jgi:dTDP-4-amino-4,6-dideoxygalactose transaminase
MAAGVAPGDEVITSPFTFIATASAIKLCGAVPVFIDIDPDTFNIEPSLIESAVTPKTKAVMPIHLYGLPADMPNIKETASKHDLLIIEDACQAHGAQIGDVKAGALGDAGCFSFYPTKNMAAGEGGIITTNSEEVMENSRLIRNHGQQARYHYVQWGCNYRMTEFAAALCNVQLPKLNDFNSKRQKNAEQLTELLKDEVATPIIPPNMTHVFHQYTIKVTSEEERDGLMKYLRSKDIITGVYYPIALHEIEFLEGRSTGALENTNQVTKTVLSLPVHPGLSEDEVSLVAKEVVAGLGEQR